MKSWYKNMCHSNPNRAQKNTVHQLLDLKKKIGVNITQNDSKNWKWHFDDIDLDKIWTVNFMWENKFFELWAKVGAALVWNLWENQHLKKNFN